MIEFNIFCSSKNEMELVNVGISEDGIEVRYQCLNCKRTILVSEFFTELESNICLSNHETRFCEWCDEIEGISLNINLLLIKQLITKYTSTSLYGEVEPVSLRAHKRTFVQIFANCK